MSTKRIVKNGDESRKKGEGKVENIDVDVRMHQQTRDPCLANVSRSPFCLVGDFRMGKSRVCRW